jgi:hypothetical protein
MCCTVSPSEARALQVETRFEGLISEVEGDRYWEKKSTLWATVAEVRGDDDDDEDDEDEDDDDDDEDDDDDDDDDDEKEEDEEEKHEK